MSYILSLLNDYLPRPIRYLMNRLLGASVLIVRIRERPTTFDLHVFLSRWHRKSSTSFTCTPMEGDDGPTHHITKTIYVVGASFEARGMGAYWTYDDLQEGWSIMEDFHQLYGKENLDA